MQGASPDAELDGRGSHDQRLDTFPGPRQPSQIWTADAAVQASVELNDTYKKLADERKDICGMTLLASRAVATPFVGALGAALALSEVMRPLHGGPVYAALDMPMTSLRHRTGAVPAAYQGLPTPFTTASHLATVARILAEQ